VCFSICVSIFVQTQPGHSHRDGISQIDVGLSRTRCKTNVINHDAGEYTVVSVEGQLLSLERKKTGQKFWFTSRDSVVKIRFRGLLAAVYDKEEFFIEEIYEILDEYVKLRDENSQTVGEITSTFQYGVTAVRFSRD